LKGSEEERGREWGWGKERGSGKERENERKGRKREDTPWNCVDNYSLLLWVSLLGLSMRQ